MNHCSHGLVTSRIWYFSLEYGDFSRTSNSWIGNLIKLEALIILNSFFSAPIPPEIGKLKNLKILSLNNCSLSGNIPAWIANLKQLSYVNLSTNNLSGKVLLVTFLKRRNLQSKSNYFCINVYFARALNNFLEIMSTKQLS